MNKPNGISDKVWEDAQAATGMYFHNGSYELIVQSVALAISKAIEETYEECAMLAYNTPHYTIGAGFGDLDGRGQLKPGSPYDAGRYDASQAIRSKGEE